MYVVYECNTLLHVVCFIITVMLVGVAAVVASGRTREGQEQPQLVLQVLVQLVVLLLLASLSKDDD